jgi:enoyl-CoA hydratase/carnithine racemase
MTSASGARPLAATAPLMLRDTDGAIATITLNRPEVRNSLSESLLIALADELRAIAADPSVRAVILAANGPAFCAGHDLKELRSRRTNPDGGRAFFAQVMTTCANVMQQIVRLPQPVIAAVSGTATAAGCQLVASCDLAIASAAAQFATPGVNIGLFCSTPMVALTRDVARKHAMEMLLTGDMVSAADAARIGLINRAVPSGTEREEALAVARKIASKSTHVVKIGKEAFYRQIEMDLAAAYDYAVRVMTENMMARDADEGISAFIEKRAATWHDR